MEVPLGGKPPPLVVVALGGNAISRENQEGNIPEQFENAQESMNYIADLIASGYRVVITHGNGPQVGNLLRRVEAAINVLYPLPLYICSADTQGGMGFMLQQFLSNALRERGFSLTPATVISQILVDKDDPAFANPTKPIGQFFTADQVRDKIDKEGWTVKEDAGRGYRRVVPSPRPRKLIEEPVIAMLAEWGFPLITCGGGGVPVIEENGILKAVDAVIDKDLATSLLARLLKADMLIITTAIEKVALNFKKPDEKLLDMMTVPEAKQFLAEGHFAPGSMGPKIEAAVEFTEATGNPTVITLPTCIMDALAGKTGTWIRSVSSFGKR
ncbi:MAG: carbamate kinase [Deltaproteobacteria bacterium]|nr:carbamate kinase [Deltaproteobacteria bacterium]